MLNAVQSFWRSLMMVMQAAQRDLQNLIILSLIGGVDPPISLFLNKLIIDEVSCLLGQKITTSAVAVLMQESVLRWSIAGLIFLGLVKDSINTLNALTIGSLRDRVQGFVQEKVLEKVANFEDIALFENPELLNKVQLTETGIQRLSHLSFILITTLNGFFSFIPAILLSASISWWIPVVLFIFSTPSVYVELKYQKQSWKVEKTQASVVRQMNIYKEVLTSPVYAKELRLFSLQGLFLERWHSLFRNMLNAMLKIRSQGSIEIIIWSMLSGLGTALPYGYVILGAIGGKYTLGDLALFAGLILQVRQSLYLLINSGADFYNVALATSPIFEILALKPQIKLLLPASNPISPQPGLTICGGLQTSSTGTAIITTLGQD